MVKRILVGCSIGPAVFCCPVLLCRPSFSRYCWHASPRGRPLSCCGPPRWPTTMECMSTPAGGGRPDPPGLSGWGRGSWSLAALSLLLMAALFLGAIRRFDSGSAISLEDLLVCMFGGIVIPAFLSTLVLLKGMEQRQISGPAAGDLRFPHGCGRLLCGGVLWEAQGHHSGQPQQITGGLCRRHPVRGGCSCCSTEPFCISSAG